MCLLTSTSVALAHSKQTISIPRIDNHTDIDLLNSLKQKETQKYKETNNEAYLFNAWYIEAKILSLKGQNNESIKRLIAITEHCTNCQTEQMAWVNYQLAYTFSNYNWKLTKEYAFRGIWIAHKSHANETLSWLYGLIANGHYREKKFQSAKKYFALAKSYINNEDTVMHASMLNNIALCDLNSSQNTSALQNFQKALRIMKSIKDTSAYSNDFLIVVEGNIGTVLNKLGKTDQAITLLEKEATYCFAHDIKLKAIQPLIELLNFYQQKGLADKENATLLKLKELTRISNDYEESKKLHEAIISYYKQKGNKDLVLLYSESLNNEMLKFYERAKEKNAEINYIDYYYKITQFKNESRIQKRILDLSLKQKTQTQILLAISTVVFVAVLFRIRSRIQAQKKQAQKDALINEQQKQLEQNKQTILEKEIKLQQDKIVNFALNLNLKRETKKSLLSHLKELKKRKNIQADEIIRELQTAINNLLHLDEKTPYVSMETDAVNLLFREILSKKHPELSKSDLDFCSYFRMELSGKEIASLNQKAEGYIRVLKNKIKNKIGLQKDESLNDYLKSIEIHS